MNLNRSDLFQRLLIDDLFNLCVCTRLTYRFSCTEVPNLDRLSELLKAVLLFEWVICFHIWSVHCSSHIKWSVQLDMQRVSAWFLAQPLDHRILNRSSSWCLNTSSHFLFLLKYGIEGGPAVMLLTKDAVTTNRCDGWRIIVWNRDWYSHLLLHLFDWHFTQKFIVRLVWKLRVDYMAWCPSWRERITFVTDDRQFINFFVRKSGGHHIYLHLTHVCYAIIWTLMLLVPGAPRCLLCFDLFVYIELAASHGNHLAPPLRVEVLMVSKATCPDGYGRRLELARQDDPCLGQLVRIIDASFRILRVDCDLAILGHSIVLRLSRFILNVLQDVSLFMRESSLWGWWCTALTIFNIDAVKRCSLHVNERYLGGGSRGRWALTVSFVYFEICIYFAGSGLRSGRRFMHIIRPDLYWGYLRRLLLSLNYRHKVIDSRHREFLEVDHCCL